MSLMPVLRIAYGVRETSCMYGQHASVLIGQATIDPLVTLDTRQRMKHVSGLQALFRLARERDWSTKPNR